MRKTPLYASLIVVALIATSPGLMLGVSSPHTSAAPAAVALSRAVRASAPLASSPTSEEGSLTAEVPFAPSLPAVIPMTAAYDPENDTLVTFNNAYAPFPYFFTATPGTLTASNAAHPLANSTTGVVFVSTTDSFYFLETSGSPIYAQLQQYNVSSGVLHAPVVLPGTGIGVSEVFDPTNGLIYATVVQSPGSPTVSTARLTAFDPQAGVVVTSLPTMPNGFYPYLLALSPNGSTLFIQGRFNNGSLHSLALLSVDLATFNETEIFLPDTSGSLNFQAGSMAFDPTDNAVYIGYSEPINTASSAYLENITVIATDPLHVVTTISMPTLHQFEYGAGSMTFDPTNSYLYLTQSSPTYLEAIPSNETIVAINGTSTTSPNPAGFITAPAYPGGAVYVPPVEPGEGGEIWFAATNQNANSGQYDVLTLPLRITSFSAAPSALDLGSGFHLNVSTEFGAGTLSYKYTSLPANCTSVDAPTLFCQPNASGTFSIDIKVSDPLGDAVSAQTQVNVYPTLSAQPSITTASPDVGQAVDFQANPSGGETPYTVTWSFGDGSSGSGISTVHAYETPGAYLVTFRLEDAFGATVNRNFSIDVSSGPSNAAILTNRSWTDVGVPVGFSAIVRNGTAPLTETWSFGDGSPSATGPSVSHSFAKAGTYLVVLKVTDADGFSTGSSMWIGVSSVPLTALIVSPLSIEAGSTITFDETVVGGTAPYVFLWNFGDGTGSTAESPVHEFAAPGNYSVFVRVTDAVGISVTNQTVVTVTKVPVPVTSPPPSNNSTTQPRVVVSTTGLSATDAALLVLGGAIAGVIVGSALVVLLTRRSRKPPSS